MGNNEILIFIFWCCVVKFFFNKEIGCDIWIFGLVFMFIEGNFLGGYFSIEEVYMIIGSINGYWLMNDDFFNRCYLIMR